jgi:hypothetical protein
MKSLAIAALLIASPAYAAALSSADGAEHVDQSAKAQAPKYIDDNSDLPSDISITNITDKAEQTATIKEVERELYELGWNTKLESCNVMVDYVQPFDAGKDTSYGISCFVRGPNGDMALTVCSDRLVGSSFAMTPFHFTRQNIGAFIWHNCQPGG